MELLQLALLGLAALGHAVFWVATVNRIHSLGLPRRVIDLLSAGCWAALFAIPLTLWSIDEAAAPLRIYIALAALFGLYAVGRRLYQLLAPHDRPAVLLANKISAVDMIEALGYCPVHGRLCTLLSRLPGNQLLDLQLQELTLQMERLPAALDELTIVHLSDLHMSGRLDKSYFQEVCALANDMDPDLTVITGDLFDADACIDWVPETLAKLRSRHGVYFVFGNHDLRVDHARARCVLGDAGLIDLGGRWLTLDIHGKRVLLAGNESPWFAPAADMQSAPVDHAGERLFRVLLSHAPDQIGWARRHDFDLMMAGHTHGGQIRFPILGPVIAPSRFGAKYASGTFHLGSTVMHVSRGAATLDPLRWNCPPELSALVLRSKTRSTASESPAR